MKANPIGKTSENYPCKNLKLGVDEGKVVYSVIQQSYLLIECTVLFERGVAMCYVSFL